MAEIPRIRCPVCGHLVFLRNVIPGLRHKVQAMVQHITSKGRGKIRHRYVEQDLPEGLIDFWIRRLEEVIKYLQKQKGISPSLLMEANQPVLQSQVSPASVRFASPMTDLSLKSQKTPTLNVQKGLPKISLEETPTFVMKSHQKPSLSLKRTS